MKYVVFQRMNLLVPVIVPEHCVHADIKIEGFKPISAGFFSIERVVNIQTESIKRAYSCARVYLSDSVADSLNLGPRLEDKKLLEDMLINSGAYAFMSF